MYSLSIIDKMEQPLYEPEISSYWRVSSTYAPVSGWLFDVAEIGKHWLSSESLGDFTSSHRRPSCRVPCTFHEHNTDSTGRSARKLVHSLLDNVPRRQTCLPNSIVMRKQTIYTVTPLIHFEFQSGIQRDYTSQTAMHRLRRDLYVIFSSCHLRYEIIHRLLYIAYYTPR